ncbi:MAG: hypothetical protein IKC48_04575 [Clostridia bacterium]|nr:hypothetical protein [Clostridia bacterium]
MKDNDFHKLIEQQNAQKKAGKYAEFEKKHDLPEANTVKAKQKHTVRYIPFGSVLSALCLIIVLTFMLNAEKFMPPDSSQTPPSHSLYEAVRIDYTVKEYSANEELPLLYIDWYDVADDVQTWLYVDINNNDDVIYIKEDIANGETGDIVYLYIMDEHTSVDIFTFFEQSCNKTAVIGEVIINWSYRSALSTAFFKYEGYKYYIQLEFPMEEDAILKIAEAMILK